MQSARVSTIVVAFVLVWALPARAFPPVVVAATDAGSSAESVYGTNERLVQTDLGTMLSVSWREVLASGGYLNLHGGFRLMLDPANELAVSDEEYVSFRFVVPLERSRLELESSLETSILDAGAASVYARPGWGVALATDRETATRTVFYEGSYRFVQHHDSNMLRTALGIRHAFTPSVRRARDLALTAGHEWWPTYRLREPTGAVSNRDRQDLTAVLDARVRGLAGYFTTWTLGGEVGGRFSNATRWIAAGDFEQDAESRVTGGLSGSINASPTRRVGLSGNASVHDTMYLGRSARDADQSTVGSHLNVFTLAGGAGVDYNPFGSLFVVVAAGGTRSFSRDPSFDFWRLQGRVSVEYSF